MTESTDAPEGAWHREYDDGWEIMLPGGGVLRVPYAATDSDRPLHEQIQRFADSVQVVPDPARPANVIEAIARCIAEMPSIGKDKLMGKEGDSQSYKYRSIEAITSHAAELFGKYGVVPMVYKTRRAVKEYTVRSGGLWTEDYLMVRYRLYGPGGKEDYITTGWFHALGRDNSDKGTNKAMTQAFKQMLVQTLVVGDNKEDPDTYSPTGGNQDERTAGGGETPQDWPTANGWPGGEPEIKAANDRVKDALSRLVSNGDLERERANELWKAFLHPDPERPDSVLYRPRADYSAWWAEHIGLPVEEPAAEPAVEGPEAQTPPPEPAEEETATEGPAVGEQEQAPPGEPEPAGMVSPEQVEDNGYRSAADEILRDAGPDELLAYLRALPVTDVVTELGHRGVGVGGPHSPDSLRRLFGGIVTARHAADLGNPPEPAEGRESGAKRRTSKPR